MKATPRELELHRAITNGDDTALSELYVEYIGQVVHALTRKRPDIAKRDIESIMTAAHDAFLGYYSKPETFNPHLSGLLGFLKMSAFGDLRNLLKKEEKHSLGKNLLEDVELWKQNGNSVLKSYGSADATILSEEIMTIIRKVLKDYFHTEQDINLAIMILSELRETEEYIEELEIMSLTVSEQRIEVKKVKDRIKKVIERNDIANRIKNLLK